MLQGDREMKPCPFCGSSEVEQRETVCDAVVACCNCGSRTGLVFLGPSEAVNAAKMREQRDLWNTRPASSPDEVERVARAIYEASNRGCSNCWDWEDTALDVEYPGTRERNLRYAQAAVAAMSKPVLSKELREAVERVKHGSLMYRNGTAIHDNEIAHARAKDLRLILSVFSDDEEGEDA